MSASVYKRAVCECLFILGAVAKSGVFASRELPECCVCLLSRVQGGTRGKTSAGYVELALVLGDPSNGPILWVLLVLESPPQEHRLWFASSPPAHSLSPFPSGVKIARSPPV